MKTILLLALLCFLRPVFATTYYFSNNSGNDSRTSAQARNPSTPWKSLKKLNSFFSNLKPGDQVLFKRGEAFYGSISIRRSGTSRSPIVIGAYGTGDRPVITGLTTLSKWVAVGNGIYETSNSSLGTRVNMVLLNDVQQAVGRYPNNGYLTFESHSGKTSITDNELSATPKWKNAELVLRTSLWTLERCKITSHSGRKIYYTANEGAYNPRNNYGYFIQNHIKTLNQLGEWYYNPSTKKLSMFFGSNAPSKSVVKAATVNSLIHSGGKSYIVFDNLTLKGANRIGVDINSGTNMTVKNCTVIFSGIDGVEASGTNFKLENSQVLYANNNGVDLTGGSGHQVRNNIIKNTYYIAGMGQSGNGMGAGIRIGKRGLVEYNQIINSGFLGLQFGGDYTVVRNNLIDTFCFVKDDGGGIYAYTHYRNFTSKGRKVTGNIVLNGIGAPEGTNVRYSSAQGIYMDGNCNGVEIAENTVANCRRGVYLHNSRNIIVRKNTLFNNQDGQLHMKHDNLGQSLKNHTVTDNIFFSKYEKHVVSSINTKGGNSEISAIGRFDNNVYARPIDKTGLILTTTYLYASSQKRTFRDFSNWKSAYNKDRSSKLSVKTFTTNPDDHIRFVFNASRVKKTISLDGSYVDAENNKFSNQIVLGAYRSAVLIKNGVQKNIAPAVSITRPVTNTSYTAPAKINLLAAATDKDGTISKVEFYNGTRLLHTEYRGTYSYSWTNVRAGTYLLTAKATDNKGKVTTSAGVKVRVVSQKSRPSMNTASSSVFKSLDFKLFPNPANNRINMNFTESLSNRRAILTIVSSLGSISKRYPVVISGKSLGVDISSLNTGMYIITLATDNLTINKKFIKVN